MSAGIYGTLMMNRVAEKNILAGNLCLTCAPHDRKSENQPEIVLMSDTARRFRIEGGSARQASRATVASFALSDSLEPDSIALPAADPAEAGNAPVLEELRALRAMMMPMQSIIENLSGNYRTELKSVTSLRSDIGEIEEAIRGTKKELAAIKVGNNIGGVDIAALELTTVVTQTEQATNDILAAAEAIETIAGSIQSETTLENAKGLAATIADKVTTIYMASNFQDLSGQRISRVVDTLNFIESRIHRMIDAWGGLQALHDLIETEIRTKEEERETEGAAALLTGPVPVNAEDHVDQSAIDALFD
jgi:chemotaxis protein CheZ